MGDDQESLDLKIMGIPIKAKGINLIVIIIMAAALATSGYLMWERMMLSTKEHEAIVDSISEVSKVNEKIGELIEEQNYIVLSNEADRKSMKDKLRRPPSLTRKLDH